MLINIPDATDMSLGDFNCALRAQVIKVGHAEVRPSLKAVADFWTLAKNGFSGQVRLVEDAHLNINIDPTYVRIPAFVEGVRCGNPRINDEDFTLIVSDWIRSERQRVFGMVVKDD